MMRLVTLVLAACALHVLVPVATAQTPAAPTPPTQAPPTEPPPGQPTLGDDKDTIEAGQKWLALIDAGKADVAWDVASKQLQSVVKRDKFVAEMREVRKPLGKFASRKPIKFARAHDLPGAPVGDYAIIEYEVNFAGGKRLSEQLVWSLEENDTWRVAGYYYR
jgi:Protein of unknown function (DUF4019)